MSIRLSASTLLNQLNNSGFYSYTTSKTRRTNDELKLSTQDKSAALSKSLRKMRKLDFDSAAGKAKAKRELEDFVDTYNELKDESAEKGSRAVTRKLEKIEKLISQYADELEDVGITKNAKNELKFDDDVFTDETISTEEFEKVFGSESDFSTDFESHLKTINYDARQNVVQTVTTAQTTVLEATDSQIEIAEHANTLATSLNALSRLDYTDAASKDLVLQYIKQFIDNYNSVLEKAKEEEKESPATDEMIALTKAEDNKNALSSIGITVDENTGTLSSTDTMETLLADNMTAVATIFTGSYGSEMKELSQTIFCDLLSTQKSNIIIDEFA